MSDLQNNGAEVVDQEKRDLLAGRRGNELDLTVQVVGILTVRRGDFLLAGAGIGSRKARLLLALLAVTRGHWISADRITDALWPDRAARRPAQNVATLISRLRQRFGSDLVEGGRALYRLGGHVGVDLSDAADLVSRAERVKEAGMALQAAGHALALLEHGDVLGAETDAKWAEPAREQRTMLVRRARLTAAEAALQVGEIGVARDMAERAVADDAFDEAAYRTLMVAHIANGEPARALIAYERLRGTLADELGTYPSTATRDLHIQILRGRSAPHTTPAAVAASGHHVPAPSGSPASPAHPRPVQTPRSVWNQLDPAADILGRLDSDHLGVIRREVREH
jgi:DNA-binding SARP family transcriptional activator